MNKIISYLLVATLCLFLAACAKDSHTIRLRNNFSQTVENVMVGTASLGTIHPGETSAYEPINAGNFTITGSTINGGTLSGAGNISGKGTHQWTVIISASGQLSIINDK